jgi:hypothetical protein
VKPAALKSIKSTASRIVVLKEYLGELPLDALEEPDEINRFKTESDYAERVELATIHRTLETLRHAMNWRMAGAYLRARTVTRERRTVTFISASESGDTFSAGSTPNRYNIEASVSTRFKNGSLWPTT